VSEESWGGSAPQAPSPLDATPEIAPDDLARLLAASAMPSPQAGARGLRRKLIGALLIGAIGIGASFMSCVGQSFTYRQAKALEGIEQQLQAIHAGCVATPKSEAPR